MIFSFQLSAITFIKSSSIFADDTTNTSDNYKSDLNQIEKDKQQTKEKIKEAEKEESQYSQQVEEVETRLLSALSDLEDLNSAQAEAKSKIDKISIELATNETQLTDIEKELQEKGEILNKRIAEIYKSNNKNYFSVLLESESFNEFVSKFKLMNSIVKQDAELIDQIKERKSSLLEIKNNMLELRKQEKEELAELDKLITKANNKRGELEEIYDEKYELFTTAKANKEALIAMEKQLEAKESEITRVLESYVYGSAPTSKFLWPTNGRFSSGFGYRRSRITGTTRMHKGVDIYAPNGTPVIAADGGQVISAEYDGGYGYAILVYHGGGYATFYAHLSGFAVSPGQYVQRGQIIGYVGTTGWTTGPHLHFEVRINGNVQNPMNYL